VSDSAAGVHGFVPALTSFVGRAAESAEVADLLGRYRLVTVTGPGGVGKTRLAAEVTRQVADRFADGVWQVELASVQEPALLPAAAAAVLGAQQAPDASIVESLLAMLSRQQLLLVLDNCEHMLAAVAELCGSLLPHADELRIMTTSREPIGVAGEARYRLPPLGLPGPGIPAGIAGSEAVVLFADRAHRVDPHFTLSDELEPVVARIVTRLDGMPLAIELAAARVETLGVEQLLDRLDDRFRLLVGTDRLAAARQRSLAATVDWSYQLLGEQERRVFRRLAVFPGAFTLEAAEMVAGLGAGQMLLHLVDCSLVTPPTSDPDGRSRYQMLETLRGYGTERLIEAAEQQEAVAMRAGYALQVAEHAAAGLDTAAGELAASRWLDAEDATLHQSLAWCLEHDRATALRLAIALAPWWRLRGRYATGYELLRAAGEQAGKDTDAWCAVQVWLGSLAPGPDDDVVSFDHFTAARNALAARGPSSLLVRAVTGRAGSLANLGRLPEAAEEARQALAMARQLGDAAGEVRALFWLATAASYTGDPQTSVSLLREALRVDQGAIPGRLIRSCCNFLSVALVEAGEFASAQESCMRGLALARQAGDLLSLTEGLKPLVELDLHAGRMSEARMHLCEAIEAASRLGPGMVLLDCIDYCGYLCAAGQQWTEAVTLWTAHAAWLQGAGIPDLPQDAQRRQELLRKARQALGPARTRTAEERGQAMTLATAAEFATMQVTSEPPKPDTTLELPRLSARERELVSLVAQGRTDAQIAEQLYISVRTVRSHLDRIRDKTGSRRRADLTRLALNAGLI